MGSVAEASQTGDASRGNGCVVLGVEVVLCVALCKELTFVCSPVLCGRCRKVTWAGCGRHRSSVRGRFPSHELCECTSWEST